MIIDYGLANLRSVINAFNCFSVDVAVAEKGEELSDADFIVLPGVGHFGVGMRAIQERNFIPWLEKMVLKGGKHFLGICLGLHFLFEKSEESEEQGFGWLKGMVRRFDEGKGIKVPHMGWNEITVQKHDGIFSWLEGPADFYFVHGFYVPIKGDAERFATATSEYGEKFVSAIQKDNICATQFHPEKSQSAGMKLIETFLSL